MRLLYCTALVLLGWGRPQAALAEPRIHRIGIVITDAVDREALPLHLMDRHAESLIDLRHRVEVLLSGLGRFETAAWEAVADGRRYAYSGPGSVEFVSHVTLHDLGKIYRNDSLVRYTGYPADVFGSGQPSGPYEIISQPAINGRLEIELVDLGNGKTFWSALQDSTAIVPHDSHVFLYNPRKYPGRTHPAVIRAHLADIIRLQALNYSVQRAMAGSDRWFVSTPSDDVATARGLLAGLVASFRAALDGNLPLEGHIAALLPEEDGEQRVLLNIGARDGVAPRLRLDIWRPLPSEQKVGQVEVVEADSSTAIARVRKIARKLRRRGEGPSPGDRVVSRKRRPVGGRSSP